MTAPLPYYEDDAVTLYNARCEDVLPTLNLSGPVHLLTDPPYFGVKPDEWDNQWGKAGEFLAWMGEWLDLAKPHLGGDASVWVFASPEMTSAVERVVAERFRVLNTVRWLKQGSMSHRASLPALRQFLPTWEGIVFAERVEQVANAYVTASEGVWRDVFTPVRESLVAWRDQHGLTNRQVDDCLGTAGMAGHYFSASQWALPTEEAWGKMFALVGGEYEQHRAEYEHLRAEYEQHRAARWRGVGGSASKSYGLLIGPPWASAVLGRLRWRRAGCIHCGATRRDRAKPASPGSRPSSRPARS